MKKIDLDKELKKFCHQLIKNKDDLHANVFLPENFFVQLFQSEEKIDKVVLTDCGEELRISLIDKNENQLLDLLKDSFLQWGAQQVTEVGRVHLYMKKEV